MYKRQVLLSSHLLSEVEIVADELVMIGRGRIVAQGTKGELLAPRGTRVVSVDDTALELVLADAGLTVQAFDGFLVVEADPAVVGRLALDARVALVELGAHGAAGLEQMFLELTAADSRSVREAALASSAA